MHLIIQQWHREVAQIFFYTDLMKNFVSVNAYLW